MKIDLKPNCKYALVVPTSMGIRLTPPAGQPVHCAHTFIVQATSAETNVASVAAFLGLPVKVLTTFVKGSPIAQLIKDNLPGFCGNTAHYRLTPPLANVPMRVEVNTSRPSGISAGSMSWNGPSVSLVTGPPEAAMR